MPANTVESRLRPTCPDAATAADVDAIERACSRAGLVTFGDVYNVVMLYHQGQPREAVLDVLARRVEGLPDVR